MLGSYKKQIAIVALIIAVVIGLGWFFVFRGSNGEEEPEAEAFPTTNIEEPTSQPTQEIKVEDLRIKVLNGSGVVGEANRVKLILEDADFTVDSTGNADNYDASETTIAARAGVPGSVVSDIQDLLEDDYTVTTTSLDGSEDVDIIVTVGDRINPPTEAPKEKSEPTAATTPTKTPTPTP